MMKMKGSINGGLWATFVVVILQVFPFSGSEGDIGLWYTLLGQNPRILDEIDTEPFADTPLHIAASSNGYVGNGVPEGENAAAAARRMAEFAGEVAILKPSFTRKLNAEGLTPMHLALQHRQWKTVRALMAHDPGLIRVKGKGGKTPLHVAAESRHPELLFELVYNCPSSIEDVTAQWKTALHVAVEAEHFQSFAVLLGCLVQMKKSELLYWKDMDGNNVLHVAVLRDQIEVARQLVLHMDDVRLKNYSGNTAATVISRSPQQANTKEIKRILQEAEEGFRGLIRAARIALEERVAHTRNPFLMYIRKIIRQENEKSRELILVAAILVATVTYQGVITPPGGVWQDGSGGTNTNASIASNSKAHYAGEMVMSARIGPYILRSSLAFMSSIAVIIAVMPLDIILGGYIGLCMILLLFSLNFAIRSTLPPDRNVYWTLSWMVFMVGTGAASLIFAARLILESISEHTRGVIVLDKAGRGIWWGYQRSDGDRDDAHPQGNQNGNQNPAGGPQV